MRFLKRLSSAVLLLGMAGMASAQVSGDVVRVLVLSNMSGVYSDLAGQGSQIAAEIAAEEMGLSAAGSNVEVLVADTNLDAQQAVAELQRVHSESPVDMVIGPISSGVAIEVQRWAEKNGIVTLHSGPSSSAFSAGNCSPLAVQWGFNTYSLSRAVTAAVVREGGDRWYFLTADYSFGHDLQNQVAQVVKASGGEVVGETVVPHPAVDMTEGLLSAVVAGANVVGLANAGEDTQLAIRQGYELGLGRQGIALVAVEFYLSDIRSLGLYVTEGLRFATSFYWNRNERTRAWSEAFRARHGAMPTSPQAGVYSATLHYLEAVDAAGTDEARAVMAQMRERPVDDGVFADDGHVARNSRMLHEMMLVQVKSPRDVRQARDYLEVLRTIPGEEAFRSFEESGCQLAAANG